VQRTRGATRVEDGLSGATCAATALAGLDWDGGEGRNVGNGTIGLLEGMLVLGVRWWSFG
jgi:hypothetical protein